MPGITPVPNRLINSANLAPSYFLECLLYNAPDWMHSIAGLSADVSPDIVNWMSQNDLSQFKCQNEQVQLLFGSLPEQWSEHDAKALVSGLANLWNNWD